MRTDAKFTEVERLLTDAGALVPYSFYGGNR